MRPLLGLTLAALLLAPQAAASSVGYDESTDTCYVVLVVAGVAQPVFQCGVAHQGTLSTDAAACSPTGCLVRAAGSAAGHAMLPGLLVLSSRLMAGDGVALVCIVGTGLNPASSIACAGSTSLFVEATPGSCADLRLLTVLSVNPSPATVYFGASIDRTYQVCRDAAGVPTIVPPGGA